MPILNTLKALRNPKPNGRNKQTEQHFGPNSFTMFILKTKNLHLLHWFFENKHQLPTRKSHTRRTNPSAIQTWLLSEVMDWEKKEPNNHSYTIDQKQILVPFNFPGHSTGADLIFATTRLAERAYKAQQGRLIGQGHFLFPMCQTQMM